MDVTGGESGLASRRRPGEFRVVLRWHADISEAAAMEVMTGIFRWHPRYAERRWARFDAENLVHTLPSLEVAETVYLRTYGVLNRHGACLSRLSMVRAQ